jgi:hypothetical protein
MAGPTLAFARAYSHTHTLPRAARPAAVADTWHVARVLKVKRHRQSALLRAGACIDSLCCSLHAYSIVP